MNVVDTRVIIIIVVAVVVVVVAAVAVCSGGAASCVGRNSEELLCFIFHTGIIFT